MEISKLLKSLDFLLNDILSGVKEEFTHIIKNEILEYQSRELNRILNNTKTFIERDSPVKFYDVYFPIKIEKFQNRFQKILNLAKVNSIESKNSIIQGNAGSGKSMFMKHLYIQATDFREIIPILIELRYVDEKLSEYLENIFYSNKISHTKNITDNILKTGKIHLFLDGFDEVPLENREKMLNEINILSKKYDKMKICISSRPEANIKSLPSFELYKIQPLTDDDVISFTTKQLLKADEKELKNVLDSLQSDKKDFNEYTKNPLLLSMYIMTFKTFSDIPNSKNRFYYQVFETIYSKHDSVNKLAFRRPKVTKFTKENFEKLLNYFSYLTLEKHKITFTKSNFEYNLERCKKLKHIPDFEIEDLIEDLVVSINIIYKEGIYYSFPHKSLQEYFSASFIVNLNLENKVEYYKNLSRTIAINPTQRLNYLSLLFEMDRNCFLENFILNLLNEALKCYYNCFGEYQQLTRNMIQTVKEIGFKTFIRLGEDDVENRLQLNNEIKNIKSLIKADIMNEKRLI